MRKPILVGFEPKDRARAPVHFGVAVARATRAPLIVASVQAGSPIVPLSSTQSLQYAVAQPELALLPDCSEAIEEVETELRALGVAVECRTLQSTSAARALHEEAEADDAGMLAVGAGSTATSLMHGSPCPVASVPRNWGPDRAIRTIGVAFVDSPEARVALHGAHALAGALRASLHVVSVVPADARDGAEEELRRVVDELGGGAAAQVDVLAGDAPDALVEASARFDLLVCGSRGYGPIRAVLLGSVSRRVVAGARCPVVVVPRGVKSSLEALLAESPGAAAPV